MFILQNPFVSTSCHFCFILRHFQENDVKPIHFKWCAHKTSAFHFNCSLKHLKICTKTRKFVKQFWLLALHAVGNSSQASPPLPQPPVTQPRTLISKLSQSSRNRSLNTSGKSSQLNPHTPPFTFFLLQPASQPLINYCFCEYLYSHFSCSSQHDVKQFCQLYSSLLMFLLSFLLSIW